MGMFFPDDPSYDLSVRQTGFNRYKQLMSFYAIHWMKVNLITVAGAIPLAAGILFSILSSSVLVLIPASIAGGMLFGPFLACLYDAILRGLRDAPGKWWEHYRRSWKQNWKGSLLPGGLLGLLAGMYAFMLYMLWCAQVFPGWGTLALYLFCGLLLILVNTLYWPQMVLFQQTNANRLRNLILFTVKYFWRVLGVSLMQLGYLAAYLLFAPWTLLLAPLIGFWFIVFLSQLMLYDHLNQELRIEEQFIPVEGNPWPEEEDEEEDGG